MMKIALLGGSGSGKTVYFSGLYYRFRNVKELPHLTPRQKQEYYLKGVDTQVGFRLSVDDIRLDGELSTNAGLLTKRPMEWPLPTRMLNRGTLNVQFDFVPVDSNLDQEDKIPANSYARKIEIFDPTGEAFTGEHRDSKNILDDLQKCDMAIAFLPMDAFLDAIAGIDDPEEVDDDLLAEIKADFVFGRVTEEMQRMNKALDKNDAFPVCFVFSKADLIPVDKIELVYRILHARIIVPFSIEHEKLLVCTCPISIADTMTGYFRANNLEWPFLFAAGSTILRNSYNLREEAETNKREAKEASDHASRMESLARERAGLPWWERAKRFVLEGETVGKYTDRANIYLKDAIEYTTDAGRKVRLAEDDKDLARHIWSCVAAEQRERKIDILMAGMLIDPRKGLA